jgi:hypothetical protein
MELHTLASHVPWLIFGMAFLVIVIRANKDDLPAIVRAMMRMGPSDDEDRKGPPSLPSR